MAIGRITRGTTGVNRLRRVDRWIAEQSAAQVPGALVVDLGYGASATTSLELHERLSRRNRSVEVLGLEIDPERVALARSELARARAAGRERFGRAIADEVRVSFELGGFEVPAPRPPTVIRAMNVLRQYDESEVVEHWASMQRALAPNGILVEGTSNEIGRVASWITLSKTEPLSLTLALRVGSIGTDAMPSPLVLAERLPKALIHRNVPGERIHDLLAELDRAWLHSAHLAPFGHGQRWQATVTSLGLAGYTLLHRRRSKLGEVTLPWSEVAPN